MTTSTPPDNTVLVLGPPMVNGQTTPVVGAHIGVPLVAYDLVTDGEGAVVLVDPPLAGTMDPDDVMWLWIEGELAALFSKTIVDPDVRTTLRIPKGRLHPDKVNKLYYTVKRGSSNIGTSEPMLEILYNRIRPGLKDRLTDPGSHSELKLLLPDVIKNGVGPDFVSAEVCVAYPYCRAYDLITLKCNGELLEPKPKVNPNQAPQPPNPGDETPIPIYFTVTRAFLDQAKRLDKKLHFSYTVTDQIGNGPDTDAPWSAVHSVDEDLDGTLLPMPILREKLNDPDDKPETIDLEKLAGGPLLVVVLTGDNRFQAGDSVTAEYIASVNGQPDDVVPANGTVEKDEFGQKVNCILRIDNDKVIAGSSVTVTYELRRPNGDLVGNSIVAKAEVDGAAPVDLLPPTLVAPATSPVDVLAYENGVTVRIEHLAALPGDHAQLIEVDPIAGTPPFPLVLINQNKRANFKLTSAFLVTRRGTTRTFCWELVRGGKPVGKSPWLVLVINSIAENDPRLPMPTIAGETGQQLKIQDLPLDAQVLSAKIPLKQQSHPVWLDFEGVDADGKAITKEVWSGDPNESSEGVSVPAQVEWLKTLKDGSPLRVLCAVNLDGIKDKTKAVLLPVRTYKISVAKALEIDTTPMVLDGFKLLQDYGWATKEVIDNVKLREASGGVPPYTYTSSDDSTANVAANGNVTGLKNGTATISVMDSAGTALNYSVHISNVYRVKADDRLMTVPEAVSWIRGQGGESYDNFFVPLTVKAIPFNFVDLHIVLRPIPASIPNGFFRWFGRGEGTNGSYAVFNSASGAFYQGMSTSEVRMPPIAFIRT